MTRSLIETPPIVNTVARRVSLNTPMPQSLFFSAKQILVNGECGQKREPSVNVLTRWPDHSIQWIELNWTGCPCCTKYWISSLTSEGNGISTTAPHQLGQSRESHEAATENEDLFNHIELTISVELANGKTLELKPRTKKILTTQTTLIEQELVNDSVTLAFVALSKLNHC